MTAFESSIVRILGIDSQPIGTGFLVAEQLAVTCAHVVALVGDTVQVQFVGRDQVLSALVLPKYKRDPNEGDIAFLQLETVPENITPLRLGASERSPSGNLFQAFGYPSVGAVEGVHARGEILGLVTENGQRLLQIRSEELNQGHSGAPVWDEKRGVVVGMVVSVYKSDASGKLRDIAFAVPSESLWEVCPEIRRLEICPYLALKPFTEATASFFFGRRALIEKLLGILRGGSRCLTVFGPSGSGKSSVVRAGLLPELKNGALPGSREWRQVTMRPADDPFGQLKAAGLDSLTLPPGEEPLILFVDQFEELFTLCPNDAREHFVCELAAALKDTRFLLIISVRDEFYSAFRAKAPALAKFEEGRIDIPTTLEREDLMAMIEFPAKAVGLELEAGLKERILEDLTRAGEVQSSTLPLLEFALSQLWENRSEDGRLTHAAYQRMEGVTGSLALWASRALEDLSEKEQPLAESLLTSLVHLGEESPRLPDTRRPRRLAEFDESTQHVIRHFADRRLLITSGETVELVHDALVPAWGKLQEWLQIDREMLRLRESVSDAARQWDEEKGRDESLLIHHGTRLRQALGLVKSQRYHLGKLEQAYLNACKKAEGKTKNWKRWAVIALPLVMLLAVGWLLWPYISRARAIPGNWAKIQGASSIEYWIMDNEVTNAQYRQCVNEGVCTASVYWPYAESDANKPVTGIDWYQANAYCEKWLGGSLPTEEGWQKAASGPNDYIYPWGNEWDPAKANLEKATNGEVQSIDKFAGSDISDYEVKNMAGNVREWTSSRLDTTVVIIRGGSWDDVHEDGMTTTQGYMGDLGKYPNIGFRCACPKGNCKDPWTGWWVWFGKY